MRAVADSCYLAEEWSDEIAVRDSHAWVAGLGAARRPSRTAAEPRNGARPGARLPQCSERDERSRSARETAATAHNASGTCALQIARMRPDLITVAVATYLSPVAGAEKVDAEVGGQDVLPRSG